MSCTRSRPNHARGRGWRSFRGYIADSLSAEIGESSQQRRGEQEFRGNPRNAPIVLARDKSLASDPLVKEIFIEAPPSVVFQFLTDPAMIIRWMGIQAEIDPKCGGMYRLHLNGREAILGEYLEVVANTRLVFTWGWEKSWHSISAGSTRVEIDLQPDGKGTRARLSHRQLLPQEE